MQFKVGDFGLSRLKDANGAMTQCGSPLWVRARGAVPACPSVPHLTHVMQAAPEVLRNERTSEACDVYSYGVFLWELAAWQSPFAHLDAVAAASRVAYEGLRPPQVPGLHHGVWSLMAACWAEDPAARPTFEHVLRWIASLGGAVLQSAPGTTGPVTPLDTGAAGAGAAPVSAAGGAQAEAPDPFINWILHQAIGAAAGRGADAAPVSGSYGSAQPQAGARQTGQQQLTGSGSPVRAEAAAPSTPAKDAPPPRSSNGHAARDGPSQERQRPRGPRQRPPSGEEYRQGQGKGGDSGASQAPLPLSQSSSSRPDASASSAVHVTAHGVAGDARGSPPAAANPYDGVSTVGGVTSDSGGIGSGGIGSGRQPQSVSLAGVDAAAPSHAQLSPPPHPLTLQQGDNALHVVSGPPSWTPASGVVVTTDAGSAPNDEAPYSRPQTSSTMSQSQPLGMPILYEDTGVNRSARDAATGMGLSELSDQVPTAQLTGTASSGGSDPDSGASMQILARLGVTLGPTWAARSPPPGTDT